jgi:uncharacterized protein RhaS with RHS repeats
VQRGSEPPAPSSREKRSSRPANENHPIPPAASRPEPRRAARTLARARPGRRTHSVSSAGLSPRKRASAARSPASTAGLTSRPTAGEHHQRTKTDQALRIAEEKYGNGITTESSYENTTGRLAGLASTHAGTDLQVLSYFYDLNGNVTSLVDATVTTAKVTDTFTFDSLDRLTDQTRKTASTTETLLHVDYDPIGNITKKDDQPYTYDSTHPHAVKTAFGETYRQDHRAARSRRRHVLHRRPARVHLRERVRRRWGSPGGGVVWQARKARAGFHGGGGRSASWASCKAS